uniref:Uncharacterized protein n=1 Tax=Quercus lobata TaxID=97700 RepID=A0A7N2LM41_QUELO
MADSAVTFLLQYLPQLLIREANYLAGVKGLVESVLRQLKLINAFLMDSEGKRNEHEIVKEIVRQIRDVAHKAEDVIDLYVDKAAKQKRRSKMGKAVHFINHKAELHDIRNQIEGINQEIEKIYKDRETFNIIRSEEEASMEARAAKELHNRRRYVEEDDVVGFVHGSSMLVKQLTEGKQELDVSSIIGMGGLGKTTLAKKVYNNVSIKSHFNCRAWVYVSQDFKCKEMLIEIFRSAMQTSESKFHPTLLGEQSDRKLEEYSEKELKDNLESYLRGKKYLIVMDDVWNEEVWDEVKTAFPDNVNGSRILITSREKEVASCARRGTLPYHLPFLNGEESWELLRKKVFRGEECPPELVNLGKQIAESCDGLPLSIVVMGGLLANKDRRTQTWEKYNRDPNRYLTDDKKKCKDILALSYTHLPRYLKPCFLYFGVYPEDYEIPVRQLIQLWIAEGFIEVTRNSTLEDVAEDYLENLIDRSLIQVASRRTDGGVKTCRIHDLLRDLCISESKEDKLSILGSTPLSFSSNSSDPSIRSLLFFHQDSFKKEHWKWVRKNFKLIRVLNIGRAVLYSIPNNVEKFFHLKYLRLEIEASDVIPDCICNLPSLETLDARRCTQKFLPTEIWKLQRLRILYLLGPVTIPAPVDTDVEALRCLQVLSTIVVDAQTASFIIQGKFPNLRKLGICYTLRNAAKVRPQEALASLHHLRHLENLKILLCRELPASPDSFPLTITKITLVDADLNVLIVLGNLPKLRILKLEDTCENNNQSLRLIAGSFPKLEVLKLDHLSIKEWKLGRGAMPSLRHLVIKKCRWLTILPQQELCGMTSLRDVEVLWTTFKLTGMLQELQKNIEFKLQIYPPTNDHYYREDLPNWHSW